MQQRRPLICGNWKLHHSVAQSRCVIRQLQQLLPPTPMHIVVAPVAVALESSCRIANRSQAVAIAAQNVFYAPQGAFTGEWSALHLRELGCRFALVGHSERRHLFAESDTAVAQKARACLQQRITPIVCMGESLPQQQQGQTQAVLAAQLTPLLHALSPRQAAQLVVAYEPIWAIGSGQAAQPQLIQQIFTFVRQLIQQLQSSTVAQQLRLLYGGSVSPQSAAAFMQQPHVDGLLVGGASLQPHTFVDLVKQAHRGWLAATACRPQ